MRQTHERIIRLARRLARTARLKVKRQKKEWKLFLSKMKRSPLFDKRTRTARARKSRKSTKKVSRACLKARERLDWNYGVSLPWRCFSTWIGGTHFRYYASGVVP
ncbi:hypothetical protein TGGT1_243700 [Toxoplasma gondii GT1]|uniref:Uncharacterized protein n=1 Tax=Toxoplasma gondii (strain ATCC 50853 / GT1) TaxID=507601 RepID=S7VU33_TOXGG|nr:hypothetical protein TGGT1_243700 [Toxoplasma gondii GT1]